MTAYVSRSLTHNFPCWSEYLVPNLHSSLTSISTSGPDHVTFSLSVTSTHSHTCAHVPVLMHTHIHVPPGPKHPASFLRGSCEEPPEDKASWASRPSAHGDTRRLCRVAPGFERNCWVAQAAVPWPKLHLFGKSNLSPPN